MWEHRTIKCGELYQLDRSRRSEFPDGIERARLVFRPKEGKKYGVTVSSCRMYPTPTRLEVRIANNGITYSMNINFFNDQEIGEIADQMMEEVCSLMSFNHDRFLESDEGYYGKLTRDFSRIVDRLADIRGIVKGYREEGYLEIASCQRGWRKTDKPQEIRADAPLTKQENGQLKPTLVKLVSIFPDLSLPFKSKEYYQLLIANF